MRVTASSQLVMHHSSSELWSCITAQVSLLMEGTEHWWHQEQSVLPHSCCIRSLSAVTPSESAPRFARLPMAGTGTTAHTHTDSDHHGHCGHHSGSGNIGYGSGLGFRAEH